METGNEHAALCILAKLTKMDDSLSYNILDADAVDPERVDKRMVELDSKPGKYRHVDHAVVDFMLISLFHDFAFGSHHGLRLAQAHFFAALHVVILPVALEMA